MAQPALDLLAAHGYTMTLVGRLWAKDLFAAHPWTVLPLPGSRIGALRDIGVNDGLLLTNSFSSAFEFRLAGICATGYARDGRSWLLGKAIKVVAGHHMVEYYYHLAAALVGTSPPMPRQLQVRISEQARLNARNLLVQHGVSDYLVLCPVAVGLHHGKVKAWNGFTRLGSELIKAGRQVVAMPGPNETEAVRKALPHATVLPESDLAVFAAILSDARLVVANDSGPGHLAAAVGARLISVFGVTDPRQTRPWSSRAMLVGSSDGWPDYEDVRCAVEDALIASD